MNAKPFLFGFLMLFVCLAAAAAGPATLGLSDPQRMQQFVEQRVRQTGASGAAWVAVENGAVASSGATGLADPESALPFDPSTPTQIGSLSKSFTAVAVMQLVETGAVELDTPVVQYLPDFTLADPEVSQQITVRHLLSHTSGISTLAGNLGQVGRGGCKGALDSRIRALADARPVSRPGRHYQYSNANYDVLGALLEQVSRLDYPQYLERHILRPLEMRDSYVFAPPDGAPFAVGHRSWFGQWRSSRGRLQGCGTAPSGGLVVSARDLGKYLAMMLNGKNDIISAESKAQMMSEQPSADGYGLGWRISDWQGIRLIWHYGQTPGFNAAAAMAPEAKAAFAIATNADSGFAFNDVRSLVNGSLYVAFGIEPSQPRTDPLRLAMYGLLLVIPLISMSYAAYLLRQRRRGRLNRPTSFGGISAKVLLPILALVGLAYFLLVLLPRMFDAPLSAAWLYYPDIALLLVIAAMALLVVACTQAWVFLAPTQHAEPVAHGS